MKTETWLFLKQFYLNHPGVFALVSSWVDDERPSEFITRWDNRQFLERLVHRAFRELSPYQTYYYVQVEDVQMEGEAYCINSELWGKILPTAWCGPDSPFRVNQQKEPQ